MVCSADFMRTCTGGFTHCNALVCTFLHPPSHLQTDAGLGVARAAQSASPELPSSRSNGDQGVTGSGVYDSLAGIAAQIERNLSHESLHGSSEHSLPTGKPKYASSRRSTSCIEVLDCALLFALSNCTVQWLTIDFQLATVHLVQMLSAMG